MLAKIGLSTSRRRACLAPSSQCDVQPHRRPRPALGRSIFSVERRDPLRASRGRAPATPFLVSLRPTSNVDAVISRNHRLTRGSEAPSSFHHDPAVEAASARHRLERHSRTLAPLIDKLPEFPRSRPRVPEAAARGWSCCGCSHRRARAVPRAFPARRNDQRLLTPTCCSPDPGRSHRLKPRTSCLAAG